MSYIENASGLAQAIADISKNFTILKFVKWITVLIIISSIILYVYDSLFTSTSFYTKQERKLEIIEKIKRISNSDSLIQAECNHKLLELIRNIDPPKSRIFNSFGSYISWFSSTKLWKFLSGFILPLIVIIGTLRDPDRNNIFLGSVFLGLLFGIIAIFIPTIYSIWFNVALTPIVQILILIPFIIKAQKSK